MMTLGGLHAPIKMCYHQLDFALRLQPQTQIPEYNIYYGFGSSFIKGDADPILEDVAHYIYMFYNGMYKTIEKLMARANRNREVKLYPNIAMYTTATAILLKKPIEFCESLLIETRVSEWIKILEENYSK